jgi:dTDP-glucose 4,6-dehydratase
LDKLTYSGRLENLRDVAEDSRYSFVRGDIQDRAVVDKIVTKGTDAIVNFAAETHVDRSIVGAGAFVLTDVYGTYNLLEAARKHEVRRFVQVSTDETYGSIEEGSFRETDPLNPSSPYSASKAGGDLIAKAFHLTYGLDVVISRSSNNFGPYQYPEKLAPKLILRALHDKSLPLYGDGKQVRDWIYVEDNCEAIDVIMRKGESGEIYNVASGVEHTNLEVASLILEALDKPGSLIRFVSDRPGHDRRYSLNIDKVKKIGWKPKHGFRKALRKTTTWYADNEWWWQPLLKDKFVQLDAPWLD